MFLCDILIIMFSLFVFLAALFTALSNLFIRKSIDSVQGSTGDPYIPQRLMASAFVIILINFATRGFLNFEHKIAIVGIIAGLLLGGLMWSVGKTMKHGPAAMTYAIVNAACVAPPFLMAILFGNSFGYEYTIQNGLGAVIVIAGLLWMGRSQDNETKSSSWLLWIIAAFAIHACFLTLFQWRALLFKTDLPSSFLLPFTCDPATGNCFTLMMFITAAALQIFLPSYEKGSTIPKQPMLIYGVLGGLINGIGSYFMLLSTEVADLPDEKILVFPLYCVILICLCNLWGKWMYKEKINWYANGLSMTGILVSLT